jgi:hypothetical protein
MKKCNYLGCKEKAKVFSKKSYCKIHAEELGLIGQTNLVNFGFPDNIPKNLKLGEYKRKRDFTKTPEPEE